MPSRSRRIALDVLSQIGRRRGFANRELDAAFKKNRDLDPRDRALATEIVYGVLRNRLLLDHAIGKVSRKPIDEIDRPALEALRIAIYQMLFLDRIPESAAVNDAVAMVPERAKAFVNGVLRNWLRRTDRSGCEELRSAPIRYLSVQHSHPAWIVERWLSRYGEKAAAAMLEANNARSPLTLRVNRARTDRGTLLRALTGHGAEPCAFSDAGVRLPHLADVAGLGPLKHGLCSVQDEAAQAVTFLLGPQPGERVLDACAAPGGKSTHIAELVGGDGEVAAMDVRKDRLALVRQNAVRLGLPRIRSVIGDAARPPESLRGPFDRVLVDAPCSALGLLRRQPEIRWRRRTEDFTDLAARQAAILTGVAPLVKPGGTLVYAVCTIEPEETDAVADAFSERHPEFRRTAARDVLPGAMAKLAANDGALRTHDPRLGMDGFFAVRWERETD